jgi:hypothetical protein
MEVVDPFVPSYQPDNNGFGDIPQEWSTPFAPADASEPATEGGSADEPAEASVAVETVPTPVPAPVTVRPVDDDGGSVAQAKDLAEKVAATLSELQSTLHASANERNAFLQERAEAQERIGALEAEAARKEEFKALLQSGAGATLTSEDLETLQSMTDALTQDPDRLTLLFNVVQQAPKLATAINVYTQLRRLADQS